MRTARALAIFAVVVTTGISACTNSTESATSDAVPTTSKAPSTTTGTTAGQTLRHLRNGEIFTEDDSGRPLAITHGDRAELRLSSEYTWNEPVVAGPGELVSLESADDAGYIAWELTTSAPGNLVISTTGVPACDDCNLEDLAFAVSITVRRS